MPSTSKALTIVSSAPANVHSGALLKQAAKTITRRVALIFRSEYETACNAIAVGLLLWQAKAAVPHGKFQPWVKTHMGERGYRSCAYYMKLALIFAEKSRITNEECLSIAALGAKTTKSSKAKDAAAKLDKFVGELSVSDLLIKHGIKGVGLKGELTEGDQAPSALTDAESAQQQLELNWAQAYEPAKSLADLIAAQAAGFLPEQRAALEAELKRALDALRAA